MLENPPVTSGVSRPATKAAAIAGSPASSAPRPPASTTRCTAMATRRRGCESSQAPISGAVASEGSVAAESTSPACPALPVRSSTSNSGASHMASASRAMKAAIR